MPPIPASPAPPSNVAASFDVCIGCGPFTPDADLNYKPWRSFVDKIKASKPAVVLLVWMLLASTFTQILQSEQLGPFVDTTHPYIQDGKIDETPSEIFHRHFINGLRDFLSLSPTSTVLIVPSVKDIISDYAVFPQGELGHEFSGGDPVSFLRIIPNLTECSNTVFSG